MIKLVKKYGVMLAVILLLVANIKTNPVYAAGNEVDIIFTSDLHSFIESYDEMIDGEQKNVGGFARLKTLIDERRTENPDTLVFDVGDVVMGTMSHALIDTEAAELRMLASFGYDAITYGNHEFDFGAKALADMYAITAEKEGLHPAFVNCNIDWTKNDEYTTTLREGMEKFGYSDYVMLDKGGVKIAVTGCLGIDAVKCSPTCELTTINYIDAVKETVKKIKENDNPDMIVCLSHSGTGVELGDTEDENLAKAVPDLDVILSGHTHTVLKDEIKVGDTHIVSLGAYSFYTGELSLTKNEKGRWDLNKYELVLMDESIKEDEEVLARVDEINRIIDDTVLKNYGFKADDVIAVSDFSFEPQRDVEDKHLEMRLGSLISDSYRYVANLTPTGKEHPFDISVAPAGTIRDTFLKGNVTVKDAFSALSLGTGPDGNIGYPLVSLYLTGKELRAVSEVDASISDLMKTARLYTSGLAIEYNPKRMVLNKVVDLWITPAILEDSRLELDDKKMYRIVTDSYSMSMLGAVTDLSKGLISVVPKYEDGTPIDDMEKCIIYDENGNEVKAWVALSEYFESFANNAEGVSQVPEYYNTTHNRKVVNDSLAPRAMFKNTSKYFYMFILIFIVLITIIVVIVKVIVKNKQKKKVYK